MGQIIYNNLKTEIFDVNDYTFTALALQVFKFQYLSNPVYKQFCDSLKVDSRKVNSIEQIPFLPIQFFKTHKIISGTAPEQQVFTSSGTTGETTSKHFVSDLTIYEKSFLKTFELFYGNINEYCILALLPSYLERSGSSLVYMTEHLINLTKENGSSFFLHNTRQLFEQLKHKKQKTILLGVSYALIDFAEQYGDEIIKNNLLENTIIMETGGMKGKRDELLKEELHQLLKNKLHVNTIHSEYGMTELLSQAYSNANGIFKTPPWMKILIRDVNDPFHYLSENKTGGINCIDLANINSCSFIATQDLGKKHTDNSFELMGRFDNSDLRGCNLLID